MADGGAVVVGFRATVSGEVFALVGGALTDGARHGPSSSGPLPFLHRAVVY